MGDSTEHARFSPSGAHRWMRCPGSIDLEAQCPDVSSSYAEEGTAAHLMAANWLNGVPDLELPVGNEMVEHVKTFVDAVLKAAEGKVMLVEQKIDFSHVVGVPDQYGTADVVIFSDDTLEIHDLKYGMGVPVVAQENEQLGIYALGALKQYESFGDFKKVKMVIHMPRLEYVSEWEVEIERLAVFAAHVKVAADNVLKGNAFFNPGEKQCRFCKGKGICPALKEKVYEEVAAGFEIMDPAVDIIVATVPTLTPEELGQRMANVALIEDWCKAVRAACEVELLAGRDVPGWKLVQGKQGNRKWADEAETETTLKKMRLKVEEMYDLKLISPTTAEKLAKKNVIGPKQWTTLQTLITRSPGVPSVAPATDKRPALQLQAAADDFDDVSKEGHDLV